MQYTYGTVEFTSGGAKFIASATADWSDAQIEIDNGKAVQIKVAGSALAYQVSNITTPSENAGHTPAGRWEATISGVIGDPTASLSDYVLYWNFTPNLALPLPNPGDVDVAAIMARSFLKLDSSWTAAPGGPGTDKGQTYQKQPISAASPLLVSSQDGTRHLIRATIATGGGAYTANIVLPLTSGVTPVTPRAHGDVCLVTMDVPVGQSLILQIKNADNTPGATVLWTWTADGVARKPWANFVFDGPTNMWVLQEASFITTTPFAGQTDFGQGYENVSGAAAIAAGGTFTSHQNSTRHVIHASFTGNTAASIILPTSGAGGPRANGDVCFVRMDFAAAQTTPVTIKTGTSGGATIWSWTGDGTARQPWANFVYDLTAAAWYLQDAGFATQTPVVSVGGDAGQSYQALLTITSPGGTTASAQDVNHSRHKIRMVLAAGSAPYTYNITLGVTSPARTAGDDVTVFMSFAASTNQTVKIYNVNTSGTLLWQFTNDGNANNVFTGFAYDGTAWYLERAGFIL